MKDVTLDIGFAWIDGQLTLLRGAPTECVECTAVSCHAIKVDKESFEMYEECLICKHRVILKDEDFPYGMDIPYPTR